MVSTREDWKGPVEGRRRIGIAVCPFAATMVLLTFLTGCEVSGRHGQALMQKPWTEISVDYCVGPGPDVKMKTWSTANAKVLRELQDSLDVESARWLSLIARMTTNRIELKTADGDTLIIHVFDAHSLSMYDAQHAGDSFSLKIRGDFVARLKAIIETAEGERIHFWYNTEVKWNRAK